MTRVGILSDTHLTAVTDGLRALLKGPFRDVDLIIHAGDTTSLAVHEYLANRPLAAVRGNMDDYELARTLPETRTMELEGRRVGIMHGRGSQEGIEERALAEFPDADIIIFGHSHLPCLRVHGRRTLFNPGAFRGSRWTAGSAGLLEIGDGILFRHLELH